MQISKAVKYEIIRRYIEERSRIDFTMFLVILNIMIYLLISEMFYLGSLKFDSDCTTAERIMHTILGVIVVALPFIIIYLVIDKIREKVILKKANSLMTNGFEIITGELESVSKIVKSKREKLAQVGLVDGIEGYALLNNTKLGDESIGRTFKLAKLDKKVNIFFDNTMESIISEVYTDIPDEALSSLQGLEDSCEIEEACVVDQVSKSYFEEFRRRYGMIILRCQICTILLGIIAYLILEYNGFFALNNFSTLRTIVTLGVPVLGVFFGLEIIKYINGEKYAQDIKHGECREFTAITETIYEKVEVSNCGELQETLMVVANGFKCRPLLRGYDIPSDNINKKIKIIMTYNNIMFYITEEMEKHLILKNNVGSETVGN